MRETMFKVLIHNGSYVDMSLLYKGIYYTRMPSLFDAKETIESIIERGKIMKDIKGRHLIPAEYFENVRECKLVEVSLVGQF